MTEGISISTFESRDQPRTRLVDDAQEAGDQRRLAALAQADHVRMRVHRIAVVACLIFMRGYGARQVIHGSVAGIFDSDERLLERASDVS